MNRDTVHLEKVSPEVVCGLTAYAVFNGNSRIGYVWSVRTLSYRGTQGWNRGIRLRDYYPVSWRCGFNRWDLPVVGFPTRKRAVEELLRKAKS